jgi:hypothetical protein
MPQVEMAPPLEHALEDGPTHFTLLEDQSDGLLIAWTPCSGNGGIRMGLAAVHLGKLNPAKRQAAATVWRRCQFKVNLSPVVV